VIALFFFLSAVGLRVREELFASPFFVRSPPIWVPICGDRTVYSQSTGALLSLDLDCRSRALLFGC